jgi:hypothetical protein
MLAVSGTLNLEPYGPGFKPHIAAEAIVARNLKDGGYPKDAKDTPETRRRSVYMFHKRVVPYPLFQAFDRPDALQGCSRREQSIVAPQALAVLNDRFVRTVAEDFATSLLAECGEDRGKLVDVAFHRALSRGPSDVERDASLKFLASQTAARADRATKGRELTADEAATTDFCQTLFGLNEFVYVD